MNNCKNNSYSCNTGCPEIVSGRCVRYTDRYLETIVVGSADTFNSAMIKINNYLEGLGNSGLTKVTTENTSSIIFSGEGTLSSPLTAIYTGPTTTPTLQQVATAGNTSSIPILITGNASTSTAGLYLGKTFIRSRGTGFAFDSLQIDGEDVQVVGNFIVSLNSPGGQIIVPQSGTKMTINSTAGINFISSDGVPAVFDTEVAGLPGTQPNHFATVSQLGTGGSEPLYIASYDEQVVPTNGTINNLSTTSNLVRLTGTGVVLTGLAATTTKAKTIVLINTTGVDVNLQHLSGSSVSTNQLYLLGEGLSIGDNVTLGNNSAVRFVYSNSKWRVTNWFGDGYHPNLRGTGTRVIEVLPSGKEIATDSFDYEYFRPDIITDQTDSQLNVLYPGVYRGTTIYCKNIAGGGMAFKKDDDVLNTWIRIPFIS